MSNLAVNVAIIRDEKILLTQQDDFETWILPGGSVEDGESIAQAAIRETKEETGLDVELTRLVGIYSRQSNFLGGHIVLFTASAIGGEMKCQAGETIAVEWFSFEQIPSPLSLGHKKRIEDVIRGATGVCTKQEFHLPNFPDGMNRKELYELRDKSELSRQEFYLHLIKDASVKEEIEIGNFE